jgi:hypothetical protein
MQVLERERHILGERAIASHDAQHGASRTMGASPSSAGRAPTTHRVDLTDHAGAGQMGRAVFDAADELVPQHTAVGVVAARQLDVGVADPGPHDPNEGLPVGGLRCGNVVTEAEPSILEPQGEHEGRLAAEHQRRARQLHESISRSCIPWRR